MHHPLLLPIARGFLEIKQQILYHFDRAVGRMVVESVHRKQIWMTQIHHNAVCGQFIHGSLGKCPWMVRMIGSQFVTQTGLASVTLNGSVFSVFILLFLVVIAIWSFADAHIYTSGVSFKNF